jgi:hypothetical protein
MQSVRAVRSAAKPKSAVGGPIRRYVVRLAGHDLSQAVDAASPMVAALLFAERLADREDAEVAVIATDAETGASERYTLALNAR